MREEFNKYLDRVREASDRLWVPSIDYEDGLILYSITYTYIASRNNVVAVDGGSGVGYSTLWMAEALENGCVGKCILYAVELDDKRFETMVNLFKDFKFYNVDIEYVHEDLRSFLRELNRSVDLIFVDIRKDQYLDVLKILEDKLSKDGIILFHNAILPPPPRSLIDEVNRRWRYTVVPTRLGILIVSRR